MGFLTNLVGAAVNTVLTPVDIVRDIADAVEGNETNNTAKRVKKVADNLEDALKDLV